MNILFNTFQTHGRARIVGLVLLITLAGCGGGEVTPSSSQNSNASSSNANVAWSPVIPASGALPNTTYRLGGGNPQSVALPPSTYQATANAPGKNYVSTETEKFLVDLLSSPDLKTLVAKCAERNGVFIPLIYPTDFDINQWLYIDSEGRKQIKNADVLGDWLHYLLPPGGSYEASPIANCFPENISQAKSTLRAVRLQLGRLGRSYYNQVAD